MKRSHLIFLISLMFEAMISVSAHGVGIDFAYDTDGRIVSARYSDNITINYTYDADGNLLGRNAISYPKRVELTINVEGKGTTAPEPGTHTYVINGSLSVSITAIPDLCHEFSYWSGAISGSDNPATVVLQEDSNDASITAHFKAFPALPGDLDCDSDVDGKDLVTLSNDISTTAVETFAGNFGKIY